MDNLDQVLDDLEVNLGLSKSDLDLRQKMAETLDDILQNALGEMIKTKRKQDRKQTLNSHYFFSGKEMVKVRMFGSSVTGFGLKDASLDLDLQILNPEVTKQHVALTSAAEVISTRNDLFG